MAPEKGEGFMRYGTREGRGRGSMKLLHADMQSHGGRGCVETWHVSKHASRRQSTVPSHQPALVLTTQRPCLDSCVPPRKTEATISSSPFCMGFG